MEADIIANMAARQARSRKRGLLRRDGITGDGVFALATIVERAVGNANQA